MKKIFLLMLIVMMCIVATTSYAQEEVVKVVVDGAGVEFDQEPVIIDSRTLVPVRKIFEALGARVEWDGDTSTVIAKKGTTTISLQIGSNRIYKTVKDDMTYFDIDTSAKLINSRTLVPVRAISEAFNAKVDWEEETRTVFVESANTKILNNFIDYEKMENDIKYYDIVIDYPTVNGNEKINDSIKMIVDKKLEDVKTEKDDLTKEDYEGSISFGWMYMPHSFQSTFDVTYDKDGVICFLVYDVNFSGGAYPNATQTAYIYDENTAQLLAPTDEIMQEAKNKFKDYIANNKDNFFENAIDILDENVIDYYLTKEGFVFYVNPTIIAPHALGVVEVSVDKIAFK